MNTYIEIILRSTSIFVFMVLAVRFFGKKQLSQLNSSDIILILLISNAVQNAMVGADTSLLGGLVSALTLFSVNFLFKKLLLKSEYFKNFMQYKPEVLIYNGDVNFATLEKFKISLEELQEAVREHGEENFTDIKLSMLEIDGSISVIAKNANLKQTKHKRKVRKSLGSFE